MTSSKQEGHWVDEGDVTTRLLVFVDKTIPKFLLDCSATAGFLSDAQDQDQLTELADNGHRAHKAVIVVDQLELAKRSDADGVLLGSPLDVSRARAQTESDFLIGALCGISRHDAMVAGDAGADYVTFGSLGPGNAASFDVLLELAEWWSDLAVIPAAIASPLTAPQVQALAALKTGFALPTQASVRGPSINREAFDPIAAVLKNSNVHQG